MSGLDHWVSAVNRPRKPLAGWLSTLSIALFFLAMLAGTHAHAQEFTGHVADTTGAAVANAKVTVLNQETGVTVAAKSTSSGDYTVPYLHPGKYTLTAEAPGFAQQQRTEITLEVGQTAVINFEMVIGALSQTITVKEDESLLAGSGDVGEVVENTRITELPLNGGNEMNLVQLTAGANLYVNPQYSRPFDDIQADLSINGGGAGNNEIMLDGVSNEAAHGDAYNGTNGQIGYQPPAEVVGEFKIVTNPYDAKYGRASGGVIDMTLKSGTNQLHGSVYEFARRTFLDANTWQNNFYGTSRTGQKLDQYGFELDGPVVIPKVYNGRDKTFFVMEFQNWHNVNPGTAVTSVPEQKWLTGDFSDLTYFDSKTGSYQPSIIYDPTTLHDNGSGVLVRDPFPGNIIPTNRIDPVAAKILSYYPAPNRTAVAGTNSWVSDFATPDPLVDYYRNALAKIDQNISGKDRITARYGYWDRIETQNSSGMPGVAASGEFPHGERVNTGAVDWVHTFTPTLLFDYRASGIDRANIAYTGPQGFDLTSLGFPGALATQLGTFSNHFIDMSFPDFQQLGNSGGQETIGASYAMLPTLTWVKSKHTFTFGMDYRILQSSMRFTQGGPGLYTDRTWTQAQYNQGDSMTGNSIASLMLGTASSGTAQLNSIYFYSQHYYAPFVQDDWKITSKLTLNLGIRYDLNSPPVERHNRIDYAFDTTATNPVTSLVNTALIPGGGPLKGGVTFVGVGGNPRSFYAATKTDIQPRFGLAYQIDPNMVFHGGFGIMYRNPAPGANTYGFSSTTQYVPSPDGMKTPNENLDNPYPTVVQPTGASQGLETELGQGPYFINPHYRTPQFQTFSAGIERRFLKSDTLELNYVGTRTYHTDSSDNINRIPAVFYAQCNILLGGSPNVCNSATQGYTTSPFYNVGPFEGSSYYTNQTIQSIQLQRPFPEFTDITEYQLNDGRSWYNALQVTGTHKFDNNLVVHGTWTWSKTMDSGGFVDTTYRVPSRNIDGSDYAHRVTLSGVYYIPVGRGKLVGNDMNRVLDEIIGGWELGTLYFIQTGSPWTLNGGTYYKGDAWVPRHSDPNIANSIRGVNPCAAQYNEQSNGSYALQPETESPSTCNGTYDFVVIPQYASNQNVIYTGIRNPGWSDWDVNLSKNFAIYDRLRLQLRLEAFNVPNHPTWAQGYDNSPTDPQFGTIVKNSVGQNNQPRQVQLGVKILW